MKVYLAIVLFLAFLPQPRQNQQASPAANNEQDAQAIPSTSPPNTPETSTNQKPPNDKTFAERHGWNYNDATAPPTWSNWSLVGVGIGGIVAALITLCAIKGQTRHIARQALSMRRQTTLLRKSADAALLNAEALINIERAWLEVYIDLGPAPNIVTHASSTTVSLTYNCKNFGKTPAWINTKQIGITILPKGTDAPNEMPPIGDFALIGPELVASDGDMPHTGTVNCEGKITDGSRGLIYGRITYFDIFRKYRTTSFGYWLREGGKLSRVPFVYPTYNEHT